MDLYLKIQNKFSVSWYSYNSNTIYISQCHSLFWDSRQPLTWKPQQNKKVTYFQYTSAEGVRPRSKMEGLEEGKERFDQTKIKHTIENRTKTNSFIWNLGLMTASSGLQQVWVAFRVLLPGVIMASLWNTPPVAFSFLGRTHIFLLSSVPLASSESQVWPSQLHPQSTHKIYTGTWPCYTLSGLGNLFWNPGESLHWLINHTFCVPTKPEPCK